MTMDLARRSAPAAVHRSPGWEDPLCERAHLPNKSLKRPARCDRFLQLRRARASGGRVAARQRLRLRPKRIEGGGRQVVSCGVTRPV